MKVRLTYVLMAFDVVLLLFLSSAIAFAFVYRTNHALRVLVTAALLGTVLFCLVSLWAFSPRLATSSHQRAGKEWSTGFRDGVAAMAGVNVPFYPYILLSSVGLAILAVTRPNSRTQ